MIDLSAIQKPECRRALLLCEAAGWIHAVGRMHPDLKIDEFKWGRLVKPVFTPEPGAESIFDPARKTEFAAAAISKFGYKSDTKNRPFNFVHGRGPLTDALEQVLTGIGIEVLGEKTNLGQLTTIWHKFLQPILMKPRYLPWLLHECHTMASKAKTDPRQTSAEAEEADAEAEETEPEAERTGPGGRKGPPGIQRGAKTAFRCSVFGMPYKTGSRQLDGSKWEELINKAAKCSDDPSPDNRKRLLRWMRDHTDDAFEDDQEPINDLSIYEKGVAVGALFKCAVAKCLLESKWPDVVQNPGKLGWHILAVRFDGLGYLARAGAIPDILARKGAIQKALDRVSHLLEWELTLASEIYSDENGSLYLIPELDGTTKEMWPNLAVSANQTLDEAVRAEFAADTSLDLEPGIAVFDAVPGNLIRIDEAVASIPPPGIRNGARILEAWRSASVTDVCTVCGLRPQGSFRSANDRETYAAEQNLCLECFENRSRRAKIWASGDKGLRETTIWIDELADDNGRCALLAGRIALEEWLQGELFETLRAGYFDGDTPRFVGKQDSFTRTQGVWRATQRFWEETADAIKAGVPTRDRYLLIPGDERPHLIPDFAYEIDIEGVRVGAVWTRGAGDGHFVTAANLDYVKTQLTDRGGIEEALSGKHLIYRPKGYERHEPGGRAPEEAEGEAVFEVKLDTTRYRPVNLILAEPRTFLCVLPASSLPDASKALRETYQTHFGKVRDRLALGFGAVIFPRGVPLYAVLQAGRKILRMPLPEQEIRVDAESALITERGSDQWYGWWRTPTGPKLRLSSGDTVSYCMSRFDYAFLSSAGQRFDIAYDTQARRLQPVDWPRSYTWLELEKLERAWQLLQGLERSQVYSLVAAIEEKRESWGVGEPQLVPYLHAALRNANWLKPPSPDQWPKLVEAAQTGLLRDAVDLNAHALKIKD